jgi:hypothetical protein
MMTQQHFHQHVKSPDFLSLQIYTLKVHPNVQTPVVGARERKTKLSNIPDEFE